MGLPPPGPRLRTVAPADTIACSGCKRRHGLARYQDRLRVCGWCGHHGRVPARERILQLADPGSADVQRLDLGDRDPLDFNDGASYRDRLESVRTATGEDESIVIARASVTGRAVVIASMDFGFFGGSLGSGAGEAFARACELAVAQGSPLIAVCISGGARMQEGIASLAQMARCSVGVTLVRDAGLPYITVLADPCYGGVTASFAVQADVILAEPHARVGFAGGRVIEQATHDKLPEGFQTSEFLLAHGMVDAVVERSAIRPVLGRLLAAFMATRDAAGPA
jgi:acetyl-CoA carboxylase carboxyl transferase subunit beta